MKIKSRFLQEKEERKRERIGVLVLLVLVPLYVWALVPETKSYDKEAYLYEQFIENSGCAFDDCPHYLKEKTIKESGGLLPPNHYEPQSWEWIRSLCTYLPEECK